MGLAVAGGCGEPRSAWSFEALEQCFSCASWRLLWMLCLPPTGGEHVGNLCIWSPGFPANAWNAQGCGALSYLSSWLGCASPLPPSSLTGEEGEASGGVRGTRGAARRSDDVHLGSFCPQPGSTPSKRSKRNSWRIKHESQPWWLEKTQNGNSFEQKQPVK